MCCSQSLTEDERLRLKQQLGVTLTSLSAGWFTSSYQSLRDSQELNISEKMIHLTEAESSESSSWGQTGIIKHFTQSASYVHKLFFWLSSSIQILLERKIFNFNINLTSENRSSVLVLSISDRVRFDSVPGILRRKRRNTGRSISRTVIQCLREAEWWMHLNSYCNFNPVETWRTLEEDLLPL